MRTRNIFKSRLAVLSVAAFCSLAIVGLAFPPAPHHVIYGLIRDELGTPLSGTAPLVILETSAGAQITGNLISGEPGINYRLTVPMDSGLTADTYKPTALQPTAPFRIKVKIGTTTYLPLEMKGDFSHLGLPAQSTRIDLTLGEDSDNDGLPDAWERLLIQMLGGNLTLADIRPNDDSDHDGLSNYAEYVAGTYAFDPADGFKLEVVSYNNGAPVLKFLAIRGHTYTVYGSTNLTAWTTIPFKLSSEGPSAVTRQSYQATDVQNLTIETAATNSAKFRFFKTRVQ